VSHDVSLSESIATDAMSILAGATGKGNSAFR
jgi:hypothetical protein